MLNRLLWSLLCLCYTTLGHWPQLIIRQMKIIIVMMPLIITFVILTASHKACC